MVANTQINNSKILIPLTPNSKAVNIKNYKEYFDSALKNENIKNIALSGNYGSGKSSILTTYFNDSNYKDKTLQISLANFEMIEKTHKTEIQKSVNTDELKNIEKNIINQILYQISENDIPLTNFKIKRELTFFQKIFLCFEVLLILSLIFPIDLIKGYNFMNFKFVLLSFFISSNLYSILKYLPIKKMSFKFQNIETEIHNQNDELFEKYADEIIYILEKSNKEILIIEDLDRFNQIDIFEKLRELNIKINNKLKDRKFVFIYAIKDDLFQDNKERTKFFDLIIPVLPFLNSANSYEKMKDELFVEYNIEDKLLYLLSFYIDDMRLLFNIHNEFVVYKNEITSENDTDNEKILSLIVLKNLFNTDFEKLKFRKGEIYKVFSSIEKYKQDIRTEINQYKEKLTMIEEDRRKIIAKTEEEFFILWYNERFASNYSTRQLISIIENDTTSFTYKDNGSNYSITYKELKNSSPYKENLDLILSEYHTSIKEKKLLTNISDLEKKLTGNLKDFILEEHVNSEMKILFRLIKFGYIDETYENYINYNYSNKNDFKFIKNVFTNNEALNYDLELEDFVKILNSFTEDDYHKEAILNFSLLDYFFINADIKKAHYLLITSISKGNNFIEQYYNLKFFESDIINTLIMNLEELKIKLDLTKLNKIDEQLILKNLHLDNEENFKVILLVNWNRYMTDKEHIYNVLSNSNISNNLKLYFIKNIKIKLDLEKFENIYYHDLIKYNKIRSSTTNIQSYFEYCNEEIDSTLSKFISENEILLESNFSNTFFKQLLNHPNIDNVSYEKIFKMNNSPKYTYEYIQDDIESDKLEILIKLNILEFSKPMIELLETRNINYISSNEKEIVQILLNNQNLHIKDLESILDSEDVDLEDRKNLFLSRIDKLNIDEVKNYLKVLSFKDSLVKIAYQEGLYFNRRLDQTEENITILEYLKNKDILTDIQFNNILRKSN